MFGAARAVFQLGVVLLIVAGLLIYVAARLVRSALAREPAAPAPEAAFRVLVAGTALVQALRLQERAGGSDLPPG